MEVVTSRTIVHPADIERSLAFYGEVLDLPVAREFGSGQPVGWCSSPVAVHRGGGGCRRRPRRRGRRPHTPTVLQSNASMALWLQVRSAAGALAEVEDRGATVLRQPVLEPWGLVEAWIEDPDGLRIHLVEVPTTIPSDGTYAACLDRRRWETRHPQPEPGRAGADERGDRLEGTGAGHRPRATGHASRRRGRGEGREILHRAARHPPGAEATRVGSARRVLVRGRLDEAPPRRGGGLPPGAQGPIPHWSSSTSMSSAIASRRPVIPPGGPRRCPDGPSGTSTTRSATASSSYRPRRPRTAAGGEPSWRRIASRGCPASGSARRARDRSPV